MRRLLGDDAEAAMESTLTAFYTPRPIAAALVGALRDLGLADGGGRAWLEPGCGSGRFLAEASSLPSPPKMIGVELDPASARIARLANPAAEVVNAALEECSVSRGSFDAAVGNVPFSDALNVKDGDSGLSLSLHDWFVLESVRSLRPGGCAALLTSRWTLDKSSSAARREIWRHADLLAAVRLPGEAFSPEMSDGPVTDALILRARTSPLPEGEPEPDWVSGRAYIPSSPDPIGYNPWFARRPEAVLGSLRAAVGRFGPTLAVEPAEGTSDLPGFIADLAAALSREAAAQVGEASRLLGIPSASRAGGEPSAVCGPREAEPLVLPRPTGAGEDRYVLDPSGRVWYGGEDGVEPVDLPAKDADLLAGMVRLRDGVESLLALEGESDDDVEVGRAIGALSEAYDSFVASHGPVSSKRAKRVWCGGGRNDVSYSTLVALETTDQRGRLLERGAMLSRRVRSPIGRMPESASTPREALAISINAEGRVDMGLIARLLGIDQAAAREALAEEVLDDPATGEPVLASVYLSGNLAAKRREVSSILDGERNGPARAALAAWDEETGLAAVVGAMREASADAEALLRKKGGWKCFCDPWFPDGEYSRPPSDRDVNALFYMRRRGADHPYSDIVPAILDDLRPGARLMDGDAPAGIWRVACTQFSSMRYGPGMDHAMAALALAARRADAVDDRAFFELAYSSLMLGGRPNSEEREWLRAFGALRPARPFTSAFLEPRHYYHHTFFDPRFRSPQTAWEDPAARTAIAALRDDPALLEYCATVPSRMWTEDGLRGFEARRAAALGTALAPDPARVAALEAALARIEASMPAPVPACDIACQLGSPWIAPRDVHDFIADEFDLDLMLSARERTLVVSRCAATSSWQVSSMARGGGSGLSPDVEQKYGTAERSPFAIVQAVLNKSDMTVRKPDPADPSGKKMVRDPQATAAAWQAYHAVEEAFSRWCLADPARADRIAAAYNELMNSTVPCRFDGSMLELPGSDPEIALRDYQKDAVARTLFSPEGTLIGHAVGAGKTYTAIAAAHEARRLGLARKPMVVVPNHLTVQWAAEWQRLYPGSRVLYMTQNDTTSGDAARRFWRRAAGGDWDAVVVGQSRFDMLRLSDEAEADAQARRAAELAGELEAAEGRDGKDSFTVKQLAKIQKKAEDAAKRLYSLTRARGERGVCFEDVGCDMLIVDEAHYYKNLSVASGLGSSASAKCDSLLAKCDYLRAKGAGSRVVFLTGTPVSNTMGELYSMQRYLAPRLLEDMGTPTFMNWVNTFGKVVEQAEVRPGGGFYIKRRLARFANLPELTAGFHCFADVKTAEDIGLDVPELTTRTVAVEATREQRELVALLASRAEVVRAGRVDPADDNMLKITSDGRKLALDPKLLFPEDPDVEPMDGGKVEACCERVLEVWRATEADRGAQLVFCDTSTPASGRWNIYDDVKRRLVAGGVPEEEVAFVHDAGDNPSRRQALFERVNAGEVRVLIGSTQKLGTGTNVQERLAAIHDLDCPWRPSDLEQRLGRIVRQGNRYKEVQAFRYVTVGTLDSFLYQTVERKQRFIAQVMTNESPTREMDDLDEAVISYAELKAIATGDPRVQERLMLENEVQRMELLRKSHSDRTASLASRASDLRGAIGELKRELGRMDACAPAFSAALGGLQDADASPAAAALWRVTVGGEPVARGETDDAIRGAVLKAIERDGEKVPGLRIGIGEYFGLDIVCRTEPSPARTTVDTYLGLGDPSTGETVWYGDPYHFVKGTALSKLRNTLKHGAAPDDLRRKVEARESELAEVEAALAAPWEGQRGLDEARERLAALGGFAAESPVLSASPSSGLRRCG